MCRHKDRPLFDGLVFLPVWFLWLAGTVPAGAMLPHLSPFFFLCNYHGGSQDYGLDRGEVVLSVHIDGNPTHYQPGAFYHVSISSSETFDSFLMTGLYTTSEDLSRNQARDQYGQSVSTGGQNLMCSIVHSQVSPRPMRTLQFLWMAPPSGTGCVHFLATATHGQQLLFKDTTVLLLCEQGVSLTQPRPILAQIHSDSVLFRDDFESEEFSPDLWLRAAGSRVSDECGSVVYGDSAVMCDSVGVREMVTMPMNLTSARVLQFSLGGGDCRHHAQADQLIAVAYGLDSCSQWMIIEEIRAPKSDDTEVHVVHLPLASRRQDTCIMFFQASNIPGSYDPLISKRPREINGPIFVPQDKESTSATTEEVSDYLLTKHWEAQTTTEKITQASTSQSTTHPMYTTAETTTTEAPRTVTVTSTASSSTSGITPVMSTILESSSATIEEGSGNFLTKQWEKLATTEKITQAATSQSSTRPLYTTTATTTRKTPIIGTTTSTASSSTPGITPETSTMSTTAESSIAQNPRTTQTPSTTHIEMVDITESKLSKIMDFGTTEKSLADSTTSDEFDYFYHIPNDQPLDGESFDQVAYHGCWAIDNIVVVNTAKNPDHIEEDFDPVDPSNWIFFPGAHIEQKCQSQGHAFVFEDRNQSVTFAVSRDLDLDLEDVEVDAVFTEDFENADTVRVQVENGHVGLDCGVVHKGKSLVFESANRRQMCTETFLAEDVHSVRFYFQFGGGTCHSSSKSPPVLMYIEDENNQTLVKEPLEADQFMTGQVVTFLIFNSTTKTNTQGNVRMCLLQKSHGGAGRDVWAVDSFGLLPLLPVKSETDKDKVLQASLNLACESDKKDNVVGFQFSTDHGSSWHEFYTPCLPSVCGQRYQALTSVFSAKDFNGWGRVTLPIPYAAQLPHVRFRAIQYGETSASWALDDVFIGKCVDLCHGHGICTNDGCSCDFGFEGEHCGESVVPLSSSLQENFEHPSVISGLANLDVVGGQISYACGVLSSGKALVFSDDGLRSVTTTEMNTTSAGTLQFTLRIGSQSVVSSCPPPDAPWEGILLESSCNGGINWEYLQQFTSQQYQNPKSISVTIPEVASGPMCQFRWRQPYHSGQGRDVWAIDDIIVTTDSSKNVLALEMMDMADFNDELMSNLGKLTDSFCHRMRSVVFSSPDKNGEARSLLSKAMRVGPGYIAQFDLVMGCGVPVATHLDNKVYFQYSVDHGITWHLVEDPCVPPDVCNTYRAGTVYHWSQLQDWTTVTVILPADTWSPQTKFRWIQPEWDATDVWGVTRVYIGHPCPDHCNGQGLCHKGVCRCKEGFSGSTCVPDYQMDSSIQADFGLRYNPSKDFTITGGEVVRAGEGCGIIVSGENIYFSKAGVRELLTKDLNTSAADFIQFYILIGGDGASCSGADLRNESVLLQFSTNGGITWDLLEELHHLEHRKSTFVHSMLPKGAKSNQTRFRWWQPSHSGHQQDQWAVDHVLIGHYTAFRSLHDDFDNSLDPMQSDQWRTVTEGIVGKYCGSGNPGLVLGNQVNDKFAVTNDLHLQPGDIIQFKINVDCGKVFRWDHPVIFQYSHDNGQTWDLVEPPCYLDQDCEGKLTEGSIYYTGTHGQWTLVMIPVGEKIAMHPTIFLWWQPGGVDNSFSIDDVYIGPPCPENCHRRGVCQDGDTCQCLGSLDHLVGENCQLLNDAPDGLLDRFDNHNMPSDLWERILGGHLGRGCGEVDRGNSLYFGGDGTREAVTVPLNTTQKRILEFSVKIGDTRNSDTCGRPRVRNEGIVVDFSTDNGITWQVLKVVEPDFDNVLPHTVILDLPWEAKKERTIFRFWQPLGIGGMRRVEWAIDSVLVGVNETSAFGFEDGFKGMMPNPHNWFYADSAIQRQTCNSQDSALEFSNKHGEQLAETWDYHITPSTFLQFDLAMGCGSLTGELYDIRLEYSTDHGRSWLPVVGKCAPPHFECSGYHLSSIYHLDQYANWTRITVALPEAAVSPNTRFRWIRPQPDKGGPLWALDNVYLGDGCPWLCSGHGVCRQGTCLCDDGFDGEFCVPETPLPMMLRDDFNSDKVDHNVWTEFYGGSNSAMCGPVVSGRAFTFHQDGIRMAVTRDMDTSMLTSMEFHFQYGCGSDKVPWPRKESVLLQSSTNGGITWKLVKEIHFSNTEQPKFFSIPLPMFAKMNATRFRFWQADNGGKMHSVWSVDNLFIGSMVINPSSLFDSFEFDTPDPMSWVFINNGHPDQYCPIHTRTDTRMSGNNALVFQHLEGGEVSLMTFDLDIGPMSVLQFDINVGCGAAAIAKYGVRLEYSTDGGMSWSLVSGSCLDVSGSECFNNHLPLTVYYAGDTLFWRRVIVSLDHLPVCGSIRFRWFQGKIPDTDFAPEWALDNVYIGMACPELCHGHGSCVGGMMCQCDEGYSGMSCSTHIQLPTFMKDDFDSVDTIIKPSGHLLWSGISDTRHDVNEENWLYWSGGHVTSNHRCGKVFTGAAFVFDKEGKRTLTTVPLDLSRANSIQFYLRLGCGLLVNSSPPVFLQFSTTGGLKWTTIEQFDFNPDSNKPKYIAVHIPFGAQTNSTQIRWWQPSSNGLYGEDWAIDQIYIGGNMYGERALQDDPDTPLNTTWLEHPGARIELTCHSDNLALHFKDMEPERYASTADVLVTEGSVLQFDLSMGCDDIKASDLCFSLQLEYSLDMGKTWQLLTEACLPSMAGCGLYHTKSSFVSDVYSGWNRVTVFLPQNVWSTQTRFRVYQRPDFHLDHSWAVQHLYVGSACPSTCAGHGRCRENTCVCDIGWAGIDCSEAVETIPNILVEDFLSGYNEKNWAKVVGGTVSQPCRRLSAGEALHFTGLCSRYLETTALNLTSARFIQFYFLYGCVKAPVNRDAGVIVEYSPDGRLTWHHLTEMHYDLYRTPTFVSLKIPENARKVGTQIRWWQPRHRGEQADDWMIDGIRVNGEDINPQLLSVNFTSGFEFLDLITADNMELGKYCEKDGVAIGKTKAYELSTLSSREVKITDGHVLQFSINVGCGEPWDASLKPVQVQYSTDHGMNWMDLVSPCLSDHSCPSHLGMRVSNYHGVHNNWRRVVLPLNGLPLSNGTRFRWKQLPNGMPDSQDWAVGDIYIGPGCPGHCSGHGFCFSEACVCDEGYGGEDCMLFDSNTVMKQLKDTFDSELQLNQTRWPWAQGGNVQMPCHTLTQGPAVVFSGPGARELVSETMDLRNARFVQYTAFMWSTGQHTDGCIQPPDDIQQAVSLQFSVDGGMRWYTLHGMAPRRYWPARHDYIPLPLDARTNSSLIRWIQADAPKGGRPRVHWALDDVYIGGWEINPSKYVQGFDEELVGDDPDAWEFSPNGVVEGMWGECVTDDKMGSAMVWSSEPRGDHQLQMFTTHQMIVQQGYMLQFKVIIGCGQYLDVCEAPKSTIKLEYRLNPGSDQWKSVQSTCLPGSRSQAHCNPHFHHHASHYTLSQFPVWTRVTILLSEATFSSSTQFRWIQEGRNGTMPWALDDIFVGEQCPDMCNGRGDCIDGRCLCDQGYFGSSCTPNPRHLLNRLFDKFEGGIYTSHWQTISGGGIGFGCGALLPYAHGKTLYFNGCGERQAITAEMDTSHAIKIMFVIQIGCFAQTENCNVLLEEGPRYRGVLLQYTKNKGAEWHLIAQHDPVDFLRPHRVAYDIPQAAKGVGAQFRWWQPLHDGRGFDQWAIDHVEIISGRRHYRRGRRRG